MKNNIIFLDIDGVLNSKNYFTNYKKKIKNVSDIVRQMSEIDVDKFNLLVDVIREVNAKVVITSSWRMLRIYPLIKEIFISSGIPIIGETKYLKGNRGKEIRDYLENNDIDNFVILDDEVFNDFGLLKNNLVKTSFYTDGLTKGSCNEIKKKLLVTEKSGKSGKSFQ